jgi:alpha-L-fucosidase
MPKFFATGFAVLLALAVSAESVEGLPKASPEEVQWWQDAQFGMFIHWGPVSLSGQPMSWSRKGPRPGHPSEFGKNGTSAEEYDNLYKQFNPVKFDAEAVVSLAKEAGAKYLVFTAKHHDGFCMFDSVYTDYDIMSTPYGRDIAKELADACHKHGIKLQWYYSQPDWTHPDYEVNPPAYNEYLRNQLIELCTNYGPIAGIWWDGLGRPPETWESDKLMPMLHELRPGIIMNHRFVGRHLMQQAGDYDTAENHIGHFQIDRPWESCIRAGGAWSWSGPNRDSMSGTTAVRTLIECAGRGGNLLLNTGPSPLGEIHPKDVAVYQAIGRWLKQVGESIYATEGGPYKPGPWGVATRRENQVFLHILQQQKGDLSIDLPPLGVDVISADVLTGGVCSFRQDADGLHLTFDKASPVATVIALTCAGDAESLPVVKTEETPSLTVGATASASSEQSARRRAEATIVADITVFDEGAHSKSFWQPKGNDSKPWIMIDLGRTANFDQIVVHEYNSAVKSFCIEARVDGGWQKVHEGQDLGRFSLKLKQPIHADMIRLTITESSGGAPAISEINLY